ncbi:protein kinase [Microbulbifer sp. VAAF005]|uniref:serine/threonine protein kinase n=1 Tax=Microbulbifer sp. VAAF005 TaxID=3034230 RepID=UPI0024AD1E4C|nr:protein kinase [Microbulbifer sp. VAAF005]WHI46396.1 protein kinase [Microbulbifer sp. VAAF005]
MPLDDSSLKAVLSAHYPGIQITGRASKSGQRTVYFCHFRDFVRPGGDEGEVCSWSSWAEVVVKVANGSNRVEVARSQQEISVLREINSPFYPKLHHFELLTFDPRTDEKLPRKLSVTIEEKISGQPLSECIDGFQTESSVIKLMLQLVTGLNVLWSGRRKYVHRDIKPENILVRDDYSIVIIDLGILRETLSKGVTASVAHMGPCTPEYASPEQAANRKLEISYKSDMFSIGVLAYKLLSGINPFSSRGESTWDEILRNILNIHPPPLREVAGVSNELSAIVERLMEKEPYRRYRRPERLLNDLREIS